VILGLTLGVAAAQNTKVEKVPVTPTNPASGKEMFDTYCAVCHGPNAKGDGPMAKSLKTAPSDLTRIATRNNGMFPLAKVRRIISGEEPLAAGHGTREMPTWGPIFSQVAWDQDLGRVRIDNLARYLEGLQGK